jgi:hypothetical protein
MTGVRKVNNTNVVECHIKPELTQYFGPRCLCMQVSVNCMHAWLLRRPTSCVEQPYDLQGYSDMVRDRHPKLPKILHDTVFMRVIELTLDVPLLQALLRADYSCTVRVGCACGDKMHWRPGAHSVQLMTYKTG